MPVIMAFILLPIALLLTAVAHLNILDGFVISITVAVMLYSKMSWHPAFCLLAFIACWIAIAFVQQTTIGFWLLSFPFSAVYAAIVVWAVHDATNGDMIWMCVAGGLSFVLFLIFHAIHSPANASGGNYSAGQTVVVIDPIAQREANESLQASAKELAELRQQFNERKAENKSKS